MADGARDRTSPPPRWTRHQADRRPARQAPDRLAAHPALGALRRQRGSSRISFSFQVSRAGARDGCAHCRRKIQRHVEPDAAWFDTLSSGPISRTSYRSVNSARLFSSPASEGMGQAWAQREIPPFLRRRVDRSGRARRAIRHRPTVSSHRPRSGPRQVFLEIARNIRSRSGDSAGRMAQGLNWSGPVVEAGSLHRPPPARAS